MHAILQLIMFKRWVMGIFMVFSVGLVRVWCRSQARPQGALEIHDFRRT